MGIINDICPADKGGGIVVLSPEQCKAEMILGDSGTYRILKSNPIKQFRNELETLVQYGAERDILNKQEEKYLVPTAFKISVIYYIPKIRKDKNTPPGKPIISGIESLTFRLGEYIDVHLQPFGKGK